MSPGYRVMNRYLLIRLIGCGAMGEVWLAYDEQLSRNVVLKRIRTDKVDSHYKTLFYRECRYQASLEPHANVVTIFDQQHEEKFGTFMVLEYVDGKNLEDAGSLSMVEKHLVAMQIARGLEHLHRHGIVHRDLKPKNIILVRDGEQLRVKIADFGLAKLASAETFTRSGTPDYISPEQIEGWAIGTPSDLYNYGGTLYWLYTGRPPFNGNYEAVLFKQLHGRPIPPRQFDPDIPREIEDLILQLLEKRPEDRVVSAAEACRRLKKIADSSTAGCRPRSGPASLRLLPSWSTPATRTTVSRAAGRGPYCWCGDPTSGHRACPRHRAGSIDERPAAAA